MNTSCQVSVLLPLCQRGWYVAMITPLGVTTRERVDEQHIPVDELRRKQ
jgi:hypothetical protein